MMKAIRNRQGDLRLVGMPAICADTLIKLPSWLEDSSAPVRGRLLPKGSSDPEAEAEWRRYAVAGAGTPVPVPGGDPPQGSGDPRVEWPSRLKHAHPWVHATAWLSALNGARQALFVLHELEPRDMERDLDELDGNDKDEARLRIAVLGWLQQLLIDLGS